MPACNGRFGVSRGVYLADSLVVIWKLTARTPSRQTLSASGRQHCGQRREKLRVNNKINSINCSEKGIKKNENEKSILGSRLIYGINNCFV